MVAEFEALADAQIEVAPVEPSGESITVTDVTP
jgi:hypothetical protein